MRHPYLQSAVTILALASLILVTDPFMSIMPTPAQMAVLVIVSVLLSVSIAFILTEQAVDEREVLHRLEASRAGYALGLATLMFALLIQGFSHSIDMWVVITIAVMLLAKVVVRFYDTLRK